MKAYVLNSIALTGNASENMLSFKPTIEQIREDFDYIAPQISKSKSQLEAAISNAYFGFQAI